MQFKKFQSVHNDKKFIIDQDLPKVGFCLYVYSGDVCVYDGLQDSLEMCKEEALEDYGVPLNSWEEILE